MKKTHSSTTAPKVRLLTHFGIASLAAFTLFNLQTLAGPQNPTVVAGNANFIQFGTHYAIQASNGAIINFDSFNIASFESVQFLQPSAAARVLARIAGGPTTIDGALTANGIVYLVNPAGVVFGNNAVVNAAGFYAAAANISNQNFLDIVSGATTEHVFTAPTGSIINLAGTSGGALAGIHVKNQVHLLGKHVSNQGIISVTNPGGAITLSAADGTIRLSQVGGNYIVQLNMTGAPVPGVGVDNTGVIRAVNNGSICCEEVCGNPSWWRPLFARGDSSCRRRYDWYGDGVQRQCAPCIRRNPHHATCHVQWLSGRQRRRCAAIADRAGRRFLCRRQRDVQ
ncbi:MAG TPA: filamentous hemagglutinin N-terminal domain-containing protein, partial [Phycisphaerales bacterium]|nr:filamentous hemagglutinin N-terminal domain-containing protein [Phycisphaerales bacterium]